VAEQWAQVVALDAGNADYHYQLGWAYDSFMQAQWSSDPVRALVAGVRAIVEYREAILRNPTSPYPYLAWGWALDSAVRLAERVAQQRLLSIPSDDIGDHRLSYFFTQLTQYPEDVAQWSRQLVQTATHLDPTGAFAHYSAGLQALQQWETLGSEERTRVVQQLRSAVQLEPKYANAIVHALWERTQDRKLVQALARGTSEEALWQGDGKNVP
jgi:hypothetical protein